MLPASKRPHANPPSPPKATAAAERLTEWSDADHVAMRDAVDDPRARQLDALGSHRSFPFFRSA